ncbi:MAG TPA: hypothetical protein VGJ37_11255 [Pyrinomonadaceae bacterium]|jgi:hypothetical protein
MRRLTASLLTFILFSQTTTAVPAKPTGDWNAVRALATRSVAVKTTNGETHYGLLESADDAGIVVRIAGAEDFTGQEISFRRDEVTKVWRARLRFGERNIAKGAWIGAGSGVGVALVVAADAAQSADPPAGAALFPIIGAGAGAIVGAFWKKKHKKQQLIYSI